MWKEYQPSHSYLRDTTHGLPKCNIYMLLTVAVQANHHYRKFSATMHITPLCVRFIQGWIVCTKRCLQTNYSYRTEELPHLGCSVIKFNTFRCMVPLHVQQSITESYLQEQDVPVPDKCSWNIEVTPHVPTCEALLTYPSTWLKETNINHKYLHLHVHDQKQNVWIDIVAIRINWLALSIYTCILVPFFIDSHFHILQHIEFLGQEIWTICSAEQEMIVFRYQEKMSIQ